MRQGKVLLKNLIFYLINLIFLSIFFIWTVYNWDEREIINDFNMPIFIWICLLAIVQFISFYLKNISKYNFCFWFIILSYPFMFGYLFRDLFSLQTSLLWNPITNYSQLELYHTYLYVIGSMELFSLGYLLRYQSNGLLNSHISETHCLGNSFSDSKDYNVFSIGRIFFVIGSIFTLSHDLPIILFMQAANTYESYSNAVSSGISGSLALFMLPGVFFLFFSGYLRRSTKNALFIIVLIYLLLFMMLTGSRKTQIFSILSLVLGYSASNLQHNISIRKVFRAIVITLFTFILFTLLITIREYRFNLGNLANGFITNLVSFNSLLMIIGEVIAETGLTGLSVASIISVVPDYLPYQYGTTFFRMIPSVLPVGWILKDFFSQASSTYVINLYTGIPVGASMFGDLYWNFGYLGIVFAFAMGMLFDHLLERRVRQSNTDNFRFNVAMYFSLFSILIILVRSEFFDVFRPLIYVLVSSYLLRRYLRKYKGRN